MVYGQVKPEIPAEPLSQSSAEEAQEPGKWTYFRIMVLGLCIKDSDFRILASCFRIQDSEISQSRTGVIVGISQKLTDFQSNVEICFFLSLYPQENYTSKLEIEKFFSTRPSFSKNTSPWRKTHSFTIVKHPFSMTSGTRV